MTRAPRLLVVDPSIAWPEQQCVAEVLRGWPGEGRVLRPALRPGDGPTPGHGYDVDGVVILGSRASAHDSHPWLGPLGEWLDPLLRGEVRTPLLAICFGHQLIAARAGGEVGLVHPDGGKEAGFQETKIEGSRLLPGAHTLRVVVSHREEVKRTPPGYRVVARRGPIAVDGMESERLPVFSFQFHPEAREEFVRRQGLDSAGLDSRVREDSDLVLEAFRALALRLLPGHRDIPLFP